MASQPSYPPAPPEEDAREPHCGVCGSLFHSTADHPEVTETPALAEWPPGYDPGEADRLIGRIPA